ncbi:MAG: hypothetical protein AAFO82_16515 [Bacteroidota bacterium]
MNLKTFLLLLCVSLSGASNGTMDKLQFHYGKSIFSQLPKEKQIFFNPQESWKLKYKDVAAKDYSPRFPLSTTLLVCFTDAWHLLKLLCESTLFLALLIAVSMKGKIAWWWILVAYVFYKLSFYVMWEWLLAI